MKQKQMIFDVKNKTSKIIEVEIPKEEIEKHEKEKAHKEKEEKLHKAEKDLKATNEELLELVEMLLDGKTLEEVKELGKDVITRRKEVKEHAKGLKEELGKPKPEPKPKGEV